MELDHTGLHSFEHIFGNPSDLCLLEQRKHILVDIPGNRLQVQYM